MSFSTISIIYSVLISSIILCMLTQRWQHLDYDSENAINYSLYFNI